MKESDIQKAIMDYLRLNGYFCNKFHTTGIYVRKRDTYMKNPNKGCPDILAFKKGFTNLAVECKSDKGVQSDEQLEWGKRFEESGGIYILARSLDDVEKVLKGVYN